MSQVTSIYNSQQWNEKIESLRDKNTNSIQQVMLPLNNVAQKNLISISNTEYHRLDRIITDNMPSNIQFNFKNEGFFNNYNSNMSFQIPIHITGLPGADADDSTIFDQTYRCNNGLTTNSRLQPIDDINNVFIDDLHIKSKSIIYNIVLYNNYICLQVHFTSQKGPSDPEVENEKVYITEQDLLIRLYKIPPSPACYLDNVLLQKNNKSDNAFNSYYNDIFRKQSFSNQLINQEFTSFSKNQYAYVNHDQDTMMVLDNNQYISNQQQFSQQQQQIQILAQYISTPAHPVTEIIYNYQVSIPLVYFHPFFQMAYNTPMELLNNELSMIVNFNEPIFSACYAYYKNFYPNNPDLEFENKINVTFEGIDDIKIILYKDSIMQYKTIERSKDGIFYIIYQNSEKAQYQAFNKTDSIVLQNLIPRVNSLNAVQISLFDSVQYVMKGSSESTINNMDYYLGYSSMWNDQGYIKQYLKQGLYLGDSGNNLPYQHIVWTQPSTLFDCALNSNIQYVKSQQDIDIKTVTFGDLQISIDDKNIIPFTYQSLEDVFRTNMAVYDYQDNKDSPNKHWQYPYWLKYYNTYIYRFDQKFGQKQQLAQPDLNGMTVQGAKSNIIFRLYQYNNNNDAPHQITNSEYQGKGFYNATNTNWINRQVNVEFLYYFSSLFVISGGDLMQVTEQAQARLSSNLPRWNYIDMKLAEDVPLLVKSVYKDEIEQELKDDINELRKMIETKKPKMVANTVTKGGQVIDANEDYKLEPDKGQKAEDELPQQDVKNMSQLEQNPSELQQQRGFPQYTQQHIRP